MIYFAYFGSGQTQSPSFGLNRPLPVPLDIAAMRERNAHFDKFYLEIFVEINNFSIENAKLKFIDNKKYVNMKCY